MTAPRAPVIGLPTFRLSSQASSSLDFLIRSASFARLRPRLPAAQLAQPLRSSNAFWAAATARSTSSRPPSGAVAIVLPIAGLTTSNVWPSAASTDSPPITIRATVGPAAAASMGARCSVVMGRFLAGTSGRRTVSSGCGYVRPWYARRAAKPLATPSKGVRSAGRAALNERLGGGHRRADDPGVIPERCGHDPRPDRQARDELVAVLADPAAENQEVRPEQLVDRVEVLVEVGRPGLPRQAPPDPGGGRRSPLGVAAADLHMPELGVRDEHPVVEQARTDTGPEGEGDHDAALADARPETHLGEARGIGVVEDDDGPGERGAEPRPEVEVDPGGIDVRRGLRHAGEHDARHRHADRDELRIDAGLLQRAPDDPDDRGHDPIRCRRLGRRDAQPRRDEHALVDVDRGRLDPATADVDTDGDVVGHLRSS